MQLDKRAKEEEETALADAKRAEDKILKGNSNSLWNEAISIKIKHLDFLELLLFYLELDRSVRGIYFRCVGEEDDAMVSIENGYIDDSEDARIVFRLNIIRP